ncbi:MAG: type II methionyl aminopeptidase [Planctomycetota bacterium]
MDPIIRNVDEYALDCFRKAGRIASECREWARENIRVGVTVRSVLETIEEMIAERGAQPAFPAQSSRNSVAAHYCSSPDDEMLYEEGDCVKVDVGVHVDGYIGDTACSVDLSTDGRWKSLVQASADALAAAIAMVGDGVQVGVVGAAIERTIEGAGFQPVRNLTGHGLARWKVHTAPQIPNYNERGRARLCTGMVVAIEPFACTGRGVIRERGRAEVFMMVRPPRKAKGLDRDVLNAIQAWRGLPIARRYFRAFDPERVEDTISKLTKQGSLVRYPPLVEEEGVMVAQTEHSMYIGPDGVEILTA